MMPPERVTRVTRAARQIGSLPALPVVRLPQPLPRPVARVRVPFVRDAVLILILAAGFRAAMPFLQWMPLMTVS